MKELMGSGEGKIADWVMQFMMDFELRLEKPNVSRAWISGATMGMSYFVGLSPS